MFLSNVVIEVTRKCNMTCEHCLRGEAQKLSISDLVLNNFFRQIRDSYIDSITITGGEPSLATDRIQAVLRFIRMYHIEVGYFYMVTNAKKVTKEFIQVILDMYMQSSEQESFAVNYSDDQFHDDLNQANIRKLSAFTFVGPKGGKIHQEAILQEGRGSNYGWREVTLYPYDIDEDQIREGLFYLNCKGDILPDCNLSYDSQDDEGLILCNVNSSFNLFKCAEEFNKKLKTHDRTTVSQLKVA